MIRLATMSSVCPDWSLDEVIEGMKRYGYLGLEPRVEWGHACGIEASLSADERRGVRERMAGEGLAICCVATGVRMALPDVGERDAQVDELKRYIDLAGDLGCPFVRTFGGQRDGGQPLVQVVDYVAEGYLQVVEQAEDRGVTVLMETHDDWCCSPPVRAVIERVDHANLQVLWDFMHPQRMLEAPEETFLAIGMLTRHTHAHDGDYDDDGRMQVGALGEGVIDHAMPMNLLNRGGYNGYFSVEVIHQPGSDADADGVLRQYAEEFRRLADQCPS